LTALGVLLVAVDGCSRQTSANAAAKSAAAQAAKQAKTEAQTKEDEAREALEQIPPPSKNRYLLVRTKDAYANPFLVVHSQTITLTVILPDLDPQAFGTNGMLRPAAARRRQFELRPGELADALASLPEDVWPYGRVAAVEEQPAPRQERVDIRRNEEAAIRTLNDLGVVVDEWSGSNDALVH
jgi:hypothetical protein